MLIKPLICPSAVCAWTPARSLTPSISAQRSSSSSQQRLQAPASAQTTNSQTVERPRVPEAWHRTEAGIRAKLQCLEYDAERHADAASKDPQFHLMPDHTVFKDDGTTAREIARAVEEIQPFLDSFIPGGPYHHLIDPETEKRHVHRVMLPIRIFGVVRRWNIPRQPTGPAALQCGFTWYTQKAM